MFLAGHTKWLPLWPRRHVRNFPRTALLRAGEEKAGAAEPQKLGHACARLLTASLRVTAPPLASPVQAPATRTCGGNRSSWLDRGHAERGRPQPHGQRVRGKHLAECDARERRADRDVAAREFLQVHALRSGQSIPTVGSRLTRSFIFSMRRRVHWNWSCWTFPCRKLRR